MFHEFNPLFVTVILMAVQALSIIIIGAVEIDGQCYHSSSCSLTELLLILTWAMWLLAFIPQIVKICNSNIVDDISLAAVSCCLVVSIILLLVSTQNKDEKLIVRICWTMLATELLIIFNHLSLHYIDPKYLQNNKIMRSIAITSPVITMTAVMWYFGTSYEIIQFSQESLEIIEWISYTTLTASSLMQLSLNYIKQSASAMSSLTLMVMSSGCAAQAIYDNIVGTSVVQRIAHCLIAITINGCIIQKLHFWRLNKHLDPLQQQCISEHQRDVSKEIIMIATLILITIHSIILLATVKIYVACVSLTIYSGVVVTGLLYINRYVFPQSSVGNLTFNNSPLSNEQQVHESLLIAALEQR